MPTHKPYGLWSSPLTPRSMSTQLRFDDIQFAGDGQTLVWCEGRSGHNVLVARRPGEAMVDLTTERNPRGGVGYGGGAFAVHGDTVFFADADGKLYRVEIDHGTPRPLTPGFGRVASPCPSPEGDWVVYVHTDGVHDVLAAVDADGRRWPAKIVSGADFYTQPAWAPDATRLVWVSWDQPNMPWNGTRLETATVTIDERGLALGPTEVWAGGDAEVALQPTFSPDGRWLAYTSDATGFAQVYVRELESGEVRQLSETPWDHTMPAWIQGIRTLAWSPDSTEVYALHNEAGVFRMLAYGLDGASREVEGLGEYEAFAQIAISPTGAIAWMGSASQVPLRFASRSPEGEVHVVRRATSERLDTQIYSKVEPVRWKAPDGTEVHGNYYAPSNPAFEGSGKPPAILMIHGGPTAQSTAAFNARNQFFATRGFAVLDVNYRGSTGYGRDYMDALFGEWGVVDVEDAVGARQFLIDQGLADPNKVVIMGGSAGGYTVLQALVEHPGVFAGRVCMYGISNLFTLAMGTHKFEASYNDSLVGTLPEASDAYRERSPIFRAERLKDPVAIFQGADDKVVPRDQSDAIVASLKGRGVDHVYHVYEGEGHGWRRADTIKHFYEHTMAFLKTHIIFS